MSVAPYVLRRVGQAVLTLFIVTVLFFLLIRFTQPQACSNMNVAEAMGCNQIMNLDQPVATQYLTWIGAILHGNFGVTPQGQSVGAGIALHLPATLLLVSVSLVLQQLIALPLGMLAATRQYSRLDQALTVVSYIALSIPAFVLGLVLLAIFAVYVPILPVGQATDPHLPTLATHGWFTLLWNHPALALGDLAKHLVLPVIVLTAGGIAVDSRFMRAAMLQVLHEDYIRTARAGGIPSRRVVLKHALRNALLPVITNLGVYASVMIGGAVVVESVFEWGGLGTLFYDSLGSDFNTEEALVLLFAVAVIVANLLADISYVWLDPRIRFGGDGP